MTTIAMVARMALCLPAVQVRYLERRRQRHSLRLNRLNFVEPSVRARGLFLNGRPMRMVNP